VAKPPSPKADALRAMREARFEQMNRNTRAPRTKPALPVVDDEGAVAPRKKRKKEK
jgi:CBS domain-containing protein